MEQEETTVDAEVAASPPAMQPPPPATPPQQTLAINTTALQAAREMRFAAPKIQDVLEPAAYERIGTVTLTDEERGALAEPVPDDEVEIRPDGLIYVSHEYIRRRLNEAFGPMQWTLAPGSPLAPRPGSSPPEYFQRWVLFIHGVYCSEALGSHVVYENKQQANDASDGGGQRTGMTIDDAAEAIKSGCLTRCAKDLGLGLQAWSRGFQRRWKREMATAVLVRQYNKGNRVLWRRVDDDPFVDRFSGQVTEVSGEDIRPKQPQQQPPPQKQQQAQRSPQTPQRPAVNTNSIADSRAEDAGQSAHTSPARDTRSEREATKELRDKPSSTVQATKTEGMVSNDGNADAGANRPVPKQQPQATVLQPPALPAGVKPILEPQRNMLVKRLGPPPDGAGLIVDGNTTVAVGWLKEHFGLAWGSDDVAPTIDNLKLLLGGWPGAGFTEIIKAIDALIKQNKEAAK